MSDVINPSVAAVMEEIRVREQEIAALREALAVLQSDRQPLVHLTIGHGGQFAISNVFQPVGGNGEGTNHVGVGLAVPPSSPPVATFIVNNGLSSRESTARVLQLFDRRRPRSIDEVAGLAGVTTRHIAVGVLTRHGYLKAKGNGYVRTAKVYTP